MPAGIPTMITAFGRTQSIADWAREIGISYTTLYYRLTKSPNMEPEKLLVKTFKPKPKKKRKLDFTVAIWGIPAFRKPCKQAAGYVFEEEEAA